MGDALLRRTASTIRGCLAPGGMAARFGGEEFAVLLPGIDLAEAIEEAERIRLAVAAQRLALRSSGERLSDVTVSLGVASLMPGQNIAMLLERADTALYRAKQEGRNRVCADAPVALKPLPASAAAKLWS